MLFIRAKPGINLIQCDIHLREGTHATNGAFGVTMVEAEQETGRW